LRKLIVSTLVTLDNVVEDPGGFSGSPHGGWAGPYFDDEAAQRSLEHLFECDYFLCGRHTYELFAKAWPNASGPYADRLNSMPKLVASTKLTGKLAWNATLIDGDVVAALRKIKQQPGGHIMMYGCPTLLRTLLQHDLVDDFDLVVCPVVVGGGRRLFDEGAPSVRLTLVSQSQLSTGAALLSYQPIGP
jgi:dihydrofolate reductase